MRLNCRIVFATATIALCSAHAHAIITIKKANGDPVPNGAATITFLPDIGEYEIHLLQLYNPNLDSVFEIRGNGGEIISLVSIDVNGPVAGSPVIVRILSDAPGGIAAVRGILETGSAETILAKVQVNLDIGWIEVEAIGDLIAGRDVLGPITATTANNSIRGVSTVTANRHILGDVMADNGRILLVNAVNGNIGSAAQPVFIRAKHSVYHVMGHDVYADINCRYNNGNGGSWALIADRFYGTMNARNLIFNQYNNLDAVYKITQAFSGRITIGQSYTSAAQVIEVPALNLGGLGGQIIINADNLPGGTWNAPVRLGPAGAAGSITLTGPRYSQTNTSLGGGSVGLVPFRLHDQSCIPANGSSIQLIPNATPLTVQLRHFGPLKWNAKMNAPVTIERRTAGTQNAYVVVPAGNFSFNISPDDANVFLVGPTVVAGSGFVPGYHYRVRATTDLKSDVPAKPAVVWDSDYLLTVTIPPCPGDVDTSGTVNINDLVFIITFWGVVNPVFPAPDLNHDGLVNIDDLVIVITHWGGCW